MDFEVTKSPQAGMWQGELTNARKENRRGCEDCIRHSQRPYPCFMSSGTWSNTMVIYVQIRTRITLIRAQMLIHLNKPPTLPLHQMSLIESHIHSQGCQNVNPCITITCILVHIFYLHFPHVHSLSFMLPTYSSLSKLIMRTSHPMCWM